MAQMTIIDAQLARKKIYEEKSYLERCISPGMPDAVKQMLEAEVTKRNAMIDELEAAITQTEEEFAARLITVPDEATLYISET